MSIVRALYSRNLTTILELKKNDWISENNGNLIIIDGFWSKAVFILKNGFYTGGISRKTKDILNNAWQLVEQIALNHSSLKLDSNDVFYQSLKGRMKKIRNVLMKLPSLCSSETLQSIKELASCPELLEARAAMTNGILPTLITDGVNGSYRLYDRNKMLLGIFKPKEEEAGMAHNPKKLGLDKGNNFKFNTGIAPGDLYLRERVAYLLGKKKPLRISVPITKIVNFSRSYFPTISGQALPPLSYQGSFQKWIHDTQPASKIYVKNKGNSIPVDEIHKLAVFDICYLNIDRHANNFLVDENKKIIPIDHGLILGNAKDLVFSWMHFTKAKEPFSNDFKQHIEEIDVDKDIALIKTKIPSIPKNNLELVKISINLLKIAVKHGLNAYQIADLMIGKKKLFDLFPQYSDFSVFICKPLLENAHLDMKEHLNKIVATYMLKNPIR